jgi:hypothetical protein
MDHTRRCEAASKGMKKMKGEVIQDPDDGFIDHQRWVKDRADDVQLMTDLMRNKVDDEVDPEPGRKVLYVSW